eukprot:s4062_g1.t1
MCRGCHALRPRPMEPLDTRRVAPATIAAKACKVCQNGKQWVPQPSEIPKPLRKLSVKLTKVLRPLDIDVGPVMKAQNGYRHHTRMIRFLWSEDSVRSRRKRERVQKAYDYLMSREAESSYGVFVEKHKKFLKKNPDAAEAQRRLPLQFLGTPGLECALWPTLYWCTETCETGERATDMRRLLRQGDRAVLNEDEDGIPGERHSAKRSFTRKALSPIVGYSQDFELLQLVYDLAMWSRIGGGKNACADLPLRLVLKGETFSPLYWKEKHQALIDMQRQCNYPTLFKTMAPWEFSFPYHIFMLDEMEKSGRGRMQSAGLEALHTAHVFTELNRGFYTGMNKRAKKGGWTEHLLAAEDGQTQTVVNFFQRLEYQDGKKKLPTQDYHGSGRVHVHSLDYLTNVQAIGLENKMSATVPGEDQPALRGIMPGRPHGRSDSGWPVEDGPSRFDPETSMAKLHHAAEDKACQPVEVKFIVFLLAAAGHRAYFKETLEITKCHQDVLHGNWYGLLLRYVATYAPKFSDSFAREWLNDEASAFSVARRVLFDYQPSEQEMWLYIFAQLIPPCRYGGKMASLLVPYPGMERVTAYEKKLLEAYEASTWRSEDMSFLEFCRKTNKDGAVHQWVVSLYKDVTDTDGDSPMSLADFANKCTMRGEKLGACDMLSIFNVRWFGQWLALRKPFRSLEDLLRNDIVEQVPIQYKHIANTTEQCPEYWDDEAQIRADLEFEAVGNDKIETFLAMVRAQRALVQRFLNGQLSKEDDAGLKDAMIDVGLLEGEEDPMFEGVEFNREQRRFEKGINNSLPTLLATHTGEPEAVRALSERPRAAERAAQVKLGLLNALARLDKLAER